MIGVSRTYNADQEKNSSVSPLLKIAAFCSSNGKKFIRDLFIPLFQPVFEALFFLKCIITN